MIDLNHLSALLDTLRPSWEKVPATAFTAAAPAVREGLRVSLAKNEAERTQLYLYDAIGGYDGVSARHMVDALSGVTGDVELHVNSPGGVIYEGAAIHNALTAYARNGRGTVHGVIDGMAASAASFVVQACATIEIEKNATMMVHDGQGLAIGTQAVMLEAAELLGMLSDTIAEMYARRGDKTGAQWRETMRTGDTWYNSAESVAAGLADRITGEEDSAPSNVLGLFVPSARIETPASAFDVDGIRNAMKGLFA